MHCHELLWRSRLGETQSRNVMRAHTPKTCKPPAWSHSADNTPYKHSIVQVSAMMGVAHRPPPHTLRLARPVLNPSLTDSAEAKRRYWRRRAKIVCLPPALCIPILGAFMDNYEASDRGFPACGSIGAVGHSKRTRVSQSVGGDSEWELVFSDRESSLDLSWWTI